MNYGASQLLGTLVVAIISPDVVDVNPSLTRRALSGRGVGAAEVRLIFGITGNHRKSPLLLDWTGLDFVPSHRLLQLFDSSVLPSSRGTTLFSFPYQPQAFA